MKKLIYLVLSVLCAISGIYGIYDTITTPQDDLATSIIAILLLAFLAWLFMHLFLKPELRHKHQAENAPEPSPEATSDAPTVETAPIAHADTNDGVEDDYVAIDIETTGLGRSARIIELGAVRIRHGRKSRVIQPARQPADSDTGQGHADHRHHRPGRQRQTHHRQSVTQVLLFLRA